MHKAMLNGNEAVARGFIEAGGRVATSYPGSPTVEIIQTLNEDFEGGYSEFSVNEKVALEVAIGAAITGARSMVAMKHVGVNVAMDPLMTFTQTKINGGFLLVSGDDPGMSSSQNEQDNRLLGKFAHMAIFDPADAQEAKDMTQLALEVSETYDLPVMLRMTSRVCHSRTPVTLGEAKQHPIGGFSKSLADYAMIPPHTFANQHHLKARIEGLGQAAKDLACNHYEDSGKYHTLIITSGLMYHNLKELELDLSIYKLGMVYPLPLDALKTLSQSYEQVVVIEEMMPFIENELKIAGIPCVGKAYFSHTGELHTENIRQGLQALGLISKPQVKGRDPYETVNRLSMFCAGCPHRPVFDILKKSKIPVIGDIGCYSLAVLEPLEVVKSIISMGASIGMMKGMSKAMTLSGQREPLVAVIGDGTFYHSGMTGLLNLLHQLDKTFNMTLIILNNGTTAMTGGQQTASTGYYSESSDMKVDMPQLIASMGFDPVQVVDQFNYKKAKGIIDQALQHEGLDIIMTTRPCALNFKIVNPHFVVNPEVCIGCRTCVKTNCPPLLMKHYEGIEDLKSSIAPDMCVGCSICSQVCPVRAIQSSKVKEKSL